MTPNAHIVIHWNFLISYPRKDILATWFQIGIGHNFQCGPMLVIWRFVCISPDVLHSCNNSLSVEEEFKNARKNFLLCQGVERACSSRGDKRSKKFRLSSGFIKSKKYNDKLFFVYIYGYWHWKSLLFDLHHFTRSNAKNILLEEFYFENNVSVLGAKNPAPSSLTSRTELTFD